MKWFVYLLAVVVFVLHQDNWNFATPGHLLFGFLPVSATYHIYYSVACAILMALLVKFAWPKHLEKYEELPTPQEAEPAGGFEVVPPRH